MLSQYGIKLHGLLIGNVNIVTSENGKPSYGGDYEAFLHKEAKKSSDGTNPHSPRPGFLYFDLNKHFRSSDCFSLGWPMHDVGEFLTGQTRWLTGSLTLEVAALGLHMHYQRFSHAHKDLIFLCYVLYYMIG